MLRHPKGSAARVLLTSVFGPYAQDDEFGSRRINPMELYHNQVTRAQGAFSPRMFHRSWGIMMIRENISAPTTLLDFPTRQLFEHEIVRGKYDIVGISSIIVNVGKVREMCRIVRRLSPGSVIVVGGHVTAIPRLEKMIDADHIVSGDGISWMRQFLGEDHTAPLRHPHVLASFGLRIMGLPLPAFANSTAATIIPSVGCPLGCNFCTTSAFFGGKGRFLNFYENGDELFNIMCNAESSLKVRSFFIMDENFLLYKKRAMELLEHMKAEGKSWSLYVFSSVNAIRKYSIREIVELGISWIWMGLESAGAKYDKLRNADTRKLVRELREHGISVLGSTIIGLEHHTPENLVDEINYAVSHNTDFHQFMLYTPVPGTPLYSELAERGQLLQNTDLADIHGQYKFNFVHPSISYDESKTYLDWAFSHDFRRNGPSIYRICRTMLSGWKQHRDDPDPRIRRRFACYRHELQYGYNLLLAGMERYLKHLDRAMSDRIRSLRKEIQSEFGWTSRSSAAVLGPLLKWAVRWEERRLARGWTYEPDPIIERSR
ncbi:MAG: radical SAM protein [Acidobacteria bacterium]|nr:radical SAM protein [Acidobacteriota bacterium]